MSRFFSDRRGTPRPVLLLLALAWWAAGGGAAAREPFADGKAAFAVKVRDLVVRYEVFLVSTLPKEALPLAVEGSVAEGEFVLEASGGTVKRTGPGRWTWTAPETPGLLRLAVRRLETGDSVVLNAFVQHPLAAVKEGVLNGYRIGAYPSTPLRGLSIYRPPAGFIEVTRENQDTPVSPHFTLRQFLCKQAGGWPKYVVLRGRLLLLLEWLLQEVNARGFRADTFTVMSGYRTPFYNRAIGNVQYSRHVWGGAADIFIDEDPKDASMDDLNRDGAVDKKDADLLYDLVAAQRRKKENERYQGGQGAYGATHVHGPFIHVDARGFRARWGR